MWIFLHKNDAKRILELDNQVGQLRLEVAAVRKGLENCESTVTDERVRLADLKEQIVNVLRRLEQRETRQKARERKNSEEEGVTPSLGLDPVSERVLERRRQRAVSAAKRTGEGVPG